MMAVGVATVLASSACAPANARRNADAPPTAVARSERPSAESTALEDAVFRLVNRHRRAAGLPSLARDSRITHQARLHSAVMAAGTTPLGHAGFDDRIAMLRRVMTFRRSAENVAFNQGHRDPAAEAVRGWLASRGHRQNIEGPYELTGIGVVSNAKGEVYFTQIFVGR
jgi:uncharacterized protein YkwD